MRDELHGRQIDLCRWRAYRYYIFDEAGQLRYANDRTGILLLSPTYLTEFFESECNLSPRRGDALYIMTAWWEKSQNRTFRFSILFRGWL